MTSATAGAAPCCPRHGAMRRRAAPSDDAAAVGSWWDCPVHCCPNSVVLPPTLSIQKGSAA